MSQRILIIGSAGSGKSTLTQKLSRTLKLPAIHLDRYYWKPDWIATPNEEWDKMVEQFSMRERWIMDGNYSRTLDIRARNADVIIFLDMPRLLCIYRVIKRRIQYHGKTRADLNEGCPEKLDPDFLKWVWNYKKRSGKRIMDKLNQLRDTKQIIILKSRKQVEELIQNTIRDGKI